MRALVISGGGSKGAFAVGALEVLRKRGYDFDVIIGTSTGGLIAPLAAIDDLDELVRIYTSVSNKDIIRLNWRRFFWDALYDTKPLESIIRKSMLETDRYARMMSSNRMIALCTVSLQTKMPVYFSSVSNGIRGLWGVREWDNEEEFVRAVLATANQPFFTPPQTIKDQQYVDGGVREILPIEMLRNLRVKSVVTITNQFLQPSKSKKEYSNILSIGLRSLSIMTNEILENELHALDGMDFINIRPKAPLGFGGLHFDPELMKRARKTGQDIAEETLNAQA